MCSATDSEAGVAWWVIQEAARQVVQSRLRTAFGTPTEFFATLEKALQHTLTASTEGSAADQFNNHQCAQLLLELVDALERNVHNATEGSVERPSPAQPVMAFFSGNRKVATPIALQG